MAGKLDKIIASEPDENAADVTQESADNYRKSADVQVSFSEMIVRNVEREAQRQLGNVGLDEAYTLAYRHWHEMLPKETSEQAAAGEQIIEALRVTAMRQFCNLQVANVLKDDESEGNFPAVYSEIPGLHYLIVQYKGSPESFLTDFLPYKVRLGGAMTFTVFFLYFLIWWRTQPHSDVYSLVKDMWPMVVSAAGVKPLRPLIESSKRAMRRKYLNAPVSEEIEQLYELLLLLEEYKRRELNMSKEYPHTREYLEIGVLNIYIAKRASDQILLLDEGDVPPALLPQVDEVDPVDS